MVIDRHQSHPMIDEDRVTAVKKIADEGDDTAVGDTDWSAGSAGEIQSQVRAAPYAVDFSPGAERACHARLARAHKRSLAKSRHRVRTRSGIAGQRSLPR